MAAWRKARLDRQFSDLSATLARHAWWVAGSTVVLFSLMWAVAIYSIALQLDKPFPLPVQVMVTNADKIVAVYYHR